MIAVVPDPGQTHVAVRFDRAIDAIELAAQSTNYVIDRYWLPWDIEQKADWFDYGSFEKARHDRDQKESEPGVLMFRWDKREAPRAALLYVFLVGETSTAGINGEQFAKAICYADLLNAPGHDPKRQGTNRPCPGKTSTTYVLGPTFSSSFASLFALMKYTDTARKFVIRSTARNLVVRVPDIARLRQFIRPVRDAVKALTETLQDDKALDQRPCPKQYRHQVAMLSEASTTLGDSADQLAKYCVDVFRYPREIAALRNAYGASTDQNVPPTNQAAGPRPSLSVNLADTANRSDEPPDFSKTQSPLSVEAALMAFAAEMRRKQYRYIGINGSNPLDIVFLTSFLRSTVPNARLFSFESDLLMQHEPDNTAYIGTLSVTTYPLLHPPLNRIGDERPDARNQIAEERPGTNLPHLPFSSQREEGIYNSTICIVRKMLNDRTLGHLSERADCSDSNPPLWLTAFGAGGPWPIEVLGPSAAPSPDLKRLSLPPLWVTVCILMCTHAGLHVLVLLGLAPFSAKFHGFRLGTVAPARQLFGIHIASATLALALALVGLSAWTPNLWSSATLLLACILPVACWLLTFKYSLWWDRNDTRGGGRLLGELSLSGFTSQIMAFVAIWIGAGTLAYLWWTLRVDQSGHYGAFFSLRALNLASFVSPLAPMLPLLAAIYIGAIFYVWHLVFHDKIRPRLNPGREQDPPSADKLRPGWRSEKFIAGAVNGDVQNATIGGVILVVWILVFQPQLKLQFELFERPQFKTLYEVLFGTVVLLILSSGFRLALIWQKLRRFLLEVNRQRARRVLVQLKGDGSSWPSIWFYGSENPDWDYMVRSLDVIQELWKTPEHPSGSEEVDTAIKTIREKRREFQAEEERDWLPTRIANRVRHRIRIDEESDGKLENAFSDAQDALAKTLNDVLDRLLVIWGYPPATSERIERQKLLEKYVALRWVAFIRAVIGRIRLSIIFLAISFSLAMISLVIYSFEPHRELLWSVTALFIVIGSITTTVLIQMHTDPVLSRITDTKPGRLDLSFYVHLVALGIAPLLTLLATHFPSIPRNVVSLLQPGLEALK